LREFSSKAYEQKLVIKLVCSSAGNLRNWQTEYDKSGSQRQEEKALYLQRSV